MYDPCEMCPIHLYMEGSPHAAHMVSDNKSWSLSSVRFNLCCSVHTLPLVWSLWSHKGPTSRRSVYPPCESLSGCYAWVPCHLLQSYNQGSYKMDDFKFENIRGFLMAVFENIFENIFLGNIWQYWCFHGQRVRQHQRQRLTTFINYIAIDYSNACQSTTFTNNAQEYRLYYFIYNKWKSHRHPFANTIDK